MWEADVLGVSPSERDVVLADYVAEKATVVGVALDIWRLIARYWDKYKQNYLHQQELYFTDGPEGDSTLSASKWDQVRALLQIYGMKPSQAMWLVEQRCGDQLDVSKLTDKQFHAAAHGLPSIEQLRVGLAYLRSNAASSSTLDEAPAPVLRRRPMISQQDGKTAFNAILIHLKKWNEDVQVFPCGSFSRGAAFISVLDVLVAVPIIKSDSASPGVETDTKCFQDVVAALTTAKVVQKGSIRQLSGTRGACVIPFKNSSILLDLKVYYPPRSWLALLYFTGPEDFVIAFFTELLQRSLREISDTSFERVYTTVVDVLGHDALLAIESEKDLFDIVDREYLLPTHRI
ncbi:unnamed protein product [Phytophthora lilii]|uniref:DNA polymerase n=1 Tax=Phytophthora lilii TaxID=2077276 RepID=A0A9W6TM52_9STRA|nr:unnamed protein product [Phytophthora lilii]